MATMTDQRDTDSVMEYPVEDRMEVLTGTLFPGEQTLDSIIDEDETMEVNERIETYLGMTDSEKKSIFQKLTPGTAVSFQLCDNHYPIYDIKGTV